MFLGQEHEILDWFIIHFTENNGMAFGIEFGGFIGKLILTLFRIIVVIFGIFYIKSVIKPELPNGFLIAIGLIIGGALGNIIDSVFYGVIFNDSYNSVASLFPESGGYAPLLHGKVVDMFYFPLINISTLCECWNLELVLDLRWGLSETWLSGRRSSRQC